jgi:hypothetical protein
VEYLQIRNWDKWQSYRNDRGQPPWIKLHRRLLREPEWVCLTDEQKGQLISLWLLAADRGGKIPASDKILMRLCHMTSEPDLNLFIKLGFIVDDVSVTSAWRQCDAPDKNRVEKSRVEKSREENKNHCVKPNGSTLATSLHFEEFWGHWPIKRNKAKAKKAFLAKKFSLEDVKELISDVEIRKQKDKQWKGGFIPHCSTYLNGQRWEDEYGS